jgi:hypothetical protein
MKSFLKSVLPYLLAIVLILGASGWLVRSHPASGVAAQSSSGAQTRAVAAAADLFLKSLTADQRKSVQFSFAPQQKPTTATFARGGGPTPGAVPPGSAGARAGAGGRGDGGRGGRGGGGFSGFVGEQFGQAVWSNFPVSDVPRPGLALGTLSADQRTAAMAILQTMLSTKGYQKVLDIMGSDQALSETGTNYASGSAYYTIGIFGTPSPAAPWMLQFGGHHLGLNLVLISEHGVLTPTLTGAQPSVYTVNGKAIRVLAQENDKAFALLNALDDAQKKQAILNYRVGDLVLGPGHSGEVVASEGLKASAMTDAQRTLLLDVVSEWAGIVHEAYAASRVEEIKAGLNDTYFAWSGPTAHEPNRNGSAYYRIQGPKLWIEFSPQGVGGDPTMHVHTIYRDPTNDYGRAVMPK